jgi:hypothetical protein
MLQSKKDIKIDGLLASLLVGWARVVGVLAAATLFSVDVARAKDYLIC